MGKFRFEIVDRKGKLMEVKPVQDGTIAYTSKKRIRCGGEIKINEKQFVLTEGYVEFNGDSDFVQVSPDFNKDAITICEWIKV
jgi:hypothetical protein